MIVLVLFRSEAETVLERHGHVHKKVTHAPTRRDSYFRPLILTSKTDAHLPARASQVAFDLPEVGERYRMLTYYMSKYLLNAAGGKKAATIVVDGVEEKHIREAAEVTVGFSGEKHGGVCGAASGMYRCERCCLVVVVSGLVVAAGRIIVGIVFVLCSSSFTD